jgi:hypothetical protein
LTKDQLEIIKEHYSTTTKLENATIGHNDILERLTNAVAELLKENREHIAITKELRNKVEGNNSH